MLYDFERLYCWKKKRRFRSPVNVLIVLPKEIDIPTMIEFYQNEGRVKFPNFKDYVEWFGGRIANPEEDLPTIDLEAEIDRAAWLWYARGVDTKKLGVKEFVPHSVDIENRERELKGKENGPF